MRSLRFEACLDVLFVQRVLEEAMHVFTDAVGIAAAETEAVALHRGEIGIYGFELGRGRGGADLAEARPRADQRIVVGAFNDDREAPLAVGRLGGGPRLGAGFL